MNWYYQIILVFMALNAFAWYGTNLVITQAPANSMIYANFSENSSAPQKVLGNLFQANVNPDNENWLKADTGKLNDSVTTESEENIPITESVIGAVLGGGGVIGYIGGFLSTVGSFFGAMYALLASSGVPTPIASIISMLWNMMFLAAITALITGRGN